MTDPNDVFDAAPRGDQAPGAAPTSMTSWRPEPWWAWTIGLLAAGAAALVAAGLSLASADLGTALRPRGCDASPLVAIALLVVAGFATSVALQVARVRWAEAFVVWDATSLVLSLPIPLALLAASLPGLLGCRVARDVAAVSGLGDALVGTPGIAVAATAAALVGSALAACVHIGWVASGLASPEAPPSIVELAIQEAEALERDPAAVRFHGVDSGE